jgi:hypothetical protein
MLDFPMNDPQKLHLEWIINFLIFQIIFSEIAALKKNSI